MKYTHQVKPLAALSAALLLLSGCAVWDAIGGKEKDAPPLPGERISVLEMDTALKVDAAGGELPPYNAPDIWGNEFWPQAGGYPSHALGNLSLPARDLQKAWSADIGEGSGRVPLTAQPIVAAQAVFTLDADSTVRAFDARSGKRLWSRSIRPEGEDEAVIGGGIGYSKGKLYASAGYEEVVALDAGSGEVLWRSPVGSPARTASTILGGRLYVMTLDNRLVALDAETGAQLWDYAGLSEGASLLGTASPAASGDLVFPAFSSGELLALRTQNGSMAWSDNLAGVLRLGGLSGLADIRGAPVVDDAGGAVYAITYGGRFAALDILTGTRLWQKDIGGADMPWLAGDRLFILTTSNQLAAVDKSTGEVIWARQLARHTDPKKRETPVVWSGPVLAGGRLVLGGTNGVMLEADPRDGSPIRQWDSGDSLAAAPVVAGGTLYVLGKDGTLTAWR